MDPRLLLFASVLVWCAGGCRANGSNTSDATTSTPTWVAAWADAPSAAIGGPQSNLTIRAIVKPTVSSRGTIRLHFSNYFGSSPVSLGAVHIGKQTSGAAVTADTVVSFGGAGGTTIAVGQTVTSDPTAFSFSYGDVLSVTEYITGSWSNLTAHAQGVDVVTNYATDANAGNKTDDMNGTSFVNTTYNTFLLDRVDVLGHYKGTVAAFGSSTTDGYHSGLDKHMTYPEQLAAALQAAGHDDIAVANVGIASTTVLGSAATAGINRFSRDVITLPGVFAVIDDLGANDLRSDCVNASDLVAGKQNIIAQAHAAGLKIYEGLMPPSTFCGTQNPNGFGTRFAQESGEEKERFLLNSWQLSAQASVVDAASVDPPASDGVSDFSGALSDPANLSYMIPAYDSQDDIHPNDDGYGKMAAAVPLDFLSP